MLYISVCENRGNAEGAMTGRVLRLNRKSLRSRRLKTAEFSPVSVNDVSVVRSGN